MVIFNKEEKVDCRKNPKKKKKIMNEICLCFLIFNYSFSWKRTMYVTCLHFFLSRWLV